MDYIGEIVKENLRNEANRKACIFINDNLAITCATNIIDQDYRNLIIYRTSNGPLREDNSYSIEAVKFPEAFSETEGRYKV